MIQAYTIAGAVTAHFVVTTLFVAGLLITTFLFDLLIYLLLLLI